jgi:hypothetical protein
VSQVQAAPVNSPTGSVNDENLRLKNDRLQGEMDKMKEDEIRQLEELVKAYADELEEADKNLILPTERKVNLDEIDAFLNEN